MTFSTCSHSGKVQLTGKDSLVGETLVNFGCQIEVKKKYYISAFLSEGKAQHQELSSPLFCDKGEVQTMHLKLLKF